MCLATTKISGWPTPLIVAGTAIFAWLYHRNISAIRATLEFVTNAELGNPAWLEGRKLFGELTGKWTHSLDKNLDRTKDIDSAALVLYLNHCELVAVAIQEKAMPEEMYKLCGRTAYVQTWVLARDYVKERRNAPGRKTLYENFQRLAERWQKDSEQAPLLLGSKLSE